MSHWFSIRIKNALKIGNHLSLYCINYWEIRILDWEWFHHWSLTWSTFVWCNCLLCFVCSTSHGFVVRSPECHALPMSKDLNKKIAFKLNVFLNQSGHLSPSHKTNQKRISQLHVIVCSFFPVSCRFFHSL